MKDISELEKIRKDAVKRVILSSIISIILITVLSCYFEVFNYVYIFLAATLVIIFSNGKINKFKKKYKEVIVLEIFKNIFTDVTYNLNAGISKEVIANTNMMRMGDNFYSNDYISAKYKNVPFEFSDIKIEEEHTDSDGDKHTTTIFKGQWYIFDFNKKFKADIQVCERGFSNAKRGGLFSNTRFNKIELEDIEFNKNFNVYAQNDLDAFYILTPHTMERIKEVNNRIHGKLLLCFINNKLHIGLYNNKDLFEPSVFKKIDIEKNHKDTLDDIMLITQFVDILNLDNTLFRREV